MIEIVYDEAKRIANLAKHALDLRDAAKVLADVTLDFEDTRRAYGERRVISIGHLHGRMVMVVWTQRGDLPRVISLRKCNAREQKLYSPHLAPAP